MIAIDEVFIMVVTITIKHAELIQEIVTMLSIPARFSLELALQDPELRS